MIGAHWKALHISMYLIFELEIEDAFCLFPKSVGMQANDWPLPYRRYFDT